jgi:hypothetical protein
LIEMKWLLCFQEREISQLEAKIESLSMETNVRSLEVPTI